MSEIILKQQEASDRLYKDSVLSNYSHEQLTPLNSFLNNSVTLLSELGSIKNDFNLKVNNFATLIEIKMDGSI